LKLGQSEFLVNEFLVAPSRFALDIPPVRLNPCGVGISTGVGVQALACPVHPEKIDHY
jgi:hypothetical protein